MKYQQLENLESGWKWAYLVKKHHEGEIITRHLEQSEAETAIGVLLKLQHQPAKIEHWIYHHMHSGLEKKLKQTIRARRKRHFNAEHPNTRKKSIDLEFLVWQRLARHAQSLGVTLSEAIVHLLEQTAGKAEYAACLLAMKQDLNALLGNTKIVSKTTQ